MEPIIEPYRGKCPTILLLGPPGAGKVTLGKFLDQAPTQKFVSTGAIFRSLHPDSPAGQLYYRYAKARQWVPDAITVEIWWHYIQGLIATNQYFPSQQDLLLEGIPRTLGQAEALAQWIDVRHIIVLESQNREELYQRMCKRARLAGQLEEMDREEFDETFSIYNQHIKDILNYYPLYLISQVNAEQRSLEVVRDVLVRLSHILSSRPSSK